MRRPTCPPSTRVATSSRNPGPASLELTKRRTAAVARGRQHHAVYARAPAGDCRGCRRQPADRLGSGIAVTTIGNAARGWWTPPRAGRRVHPHLLHGDPYEHYVAVAEQLNGWPRAGATSARRCSIRRRGGGERDQVAAAIPANRLWWRSTTHITVAPTWRWR
ncbi:4-aminobutyrate transaminase domain protein [Mycobacterium xenopi 4042]|uniref:4-aminobutyrate transaminase domain protein n=1 Tax=Mycobacterium xenopi 4042 TaxID=1299334 RepID=X8APC2_MYCXE|nr:4-aminobutyrate transaminase domain protein [Mycobacterium xenopi 4042]